MAVAEEGWDQPAAHMHAEVEAYFAALGQVASGAAAETALPLLLLSVGQLCAAGARVGALVDVVPVERFEPDAGPDADLETLRAGLHELLGDTGGYGLCQDHRDGVAELAHDLGQGIVRLVVVAGGSGGLTHGPHSTARGKWWARGRVCAMVATHRDGPAAAGRAPRTGGSAGPPGAGAGGDEERGRGAEKMISLQRNDRAPAGAAEPAGRLTATSTTCPPRDRALRGRAGASARP